MEDLFIWPCFFLISGLSISNRKSFLFFHNNDMVYGKVHGLSNDATTYFQYNRKWSWIPVPRMQHKQSASRHATDKGLGIIWRSILFRSLPYMVWKCNQYQSVTHNFFGWKLDFFHFSLCLGCLVSSIATAQWIIFLLSISLPEMIVEISLGVVLIGLYLFASRRPKHFPPGNYSQSS